VARGKRTPPRGGKRISIDEAFRKLRPALGPDGALELINTAMRDRKRARLFCDGREVNPNFIRDHLIVKGPGPLGKGRRRRIAEIVATRALDKPVKSYNWRMDADEIEALLPPKPPPPTADDAQRPRKRRGSRTQAAIREIAAEKWPGGCDHIELPDIKKVVGPILEKRGMRDPGRDTYSRALGRRDD
jgi:hypothetical protein